MNILVLNGSPKGNNSITIQTVNYLAASFPKDHFEILPVAAKIKYYTSNLSILIEKMKSADCILFSYPVYTFMAPAQLHSLIEALKKSGVSFKGKFATQITTSKHFYDVTAHQYIEDNCKDMGFTVLEGFSADMEDLPQKKGQSQAINFWKFIHWNISGRRYLKTNKEQFTLTIVTDATEKDTSLNELIYYFRKVFPCQTQIVNLNDFAFQGGCLGCLKCAATGKCFYTDGFDSLLRNKIQNTSGIVYAFTIKDHSMGALFKYYDDRQFCNGHRTVTSGQPVGYLISGNYSAETNLQTILKARAQVGGNYFVGCATDESSPVSAVNHLADSFLFALLNSYMPPKNFYGIGGLKIFRDLIYQMQGLMKQDHKFFKEHGLYDFPQNKKGTIAAMYLVGMLFSNPKLMLKMNQKINEGMLSPYERTIKKAKKP